MMDTVFEIKPPELLVVKMELARSVPVELVLEKQVYRDEYSAMLVEEFVTAPDVSVPVTIEKDTLPYALLTKVDHQSLLSNSASISIRVVEKRNIRIKLKNLEFLKDVFGEDASMKLTLSHDGALKHWQTEEMEISASQSNAEASVWISDDIDEVIQQFGRQKRYRTAHGEVSSLNGNFSIHATWNIHPRPKLVELSKKFDRHQKFIVARSFDHTVELISSSGKTFKISKARLAAFSEKIEKQLQFLLEEAGDARSLKAIKIFSGMQDENGDDHFLNEDSIRALVKFVTMNSIREPLENPGLCLELMMAASYNMIFELEKAMALILLAQPLKLFNLETSAYLYWFSSVKVGTNANDDKLRRFWERLKVRAHWNMKWTSKDELDACDALQELFPDQISRDNFFSSLCDTQ